MQLFFKLACYMNMITFFRRITLISSVFIILIFTGCKENSEYGTITLDTTLAWHGSDLAIGDTVYDYLNRPVRPEKLSCYVSDISLRSMNGEWVNSSSISRLDFIPISASASGDFTSRNLCSSEKFDAIKFNVGVPSELNQGVDPTSYPNSHPLGFNGSAGMRWDMHNSYFFVKFEGKLAEVDGGSIIVPYTLHPATDPLSRTVLIETDDFTFLTNDDLVFQLVLDIGSSLEGDYGNIDLSQVGHSMGEVPKAIMFMDNIKSSWTLK